MTKARPQSLPQRNTRTENLTAGHDLAMGKYGFSPGMTYFATAVQGAVIEDGAWVERQVAEPLLREFLALLEEIQEELNSRWNGQERSGRP
ncbi:hypothetical protein QFZ66_004227 [Streptomyces sp. B4I13]|uniref:hypothetical protein n=1 Tax=Streptomyces sp. B4I13 TaxID=3042271 RepID=UPI002789001B|nr:hypothetical protein [Streptomyces sp. B4I13]MDQ0960349.1 hypothetical protein [Streptomyces sp. B4I13]